MEGLEWGKIITAFIACAIKPGLVGLPTTVFAFHFTFLQTLLVSGTAGVCGSIVFGFVSDEALRLYEWVMKKIFPNRKKPKRFTRMNRFVIKAKKYFGIPGIAALAPLILSIPLGSFLAIRFFRDRHKTIIWMSAMSVAWTIVLYFIYNGFYESLSKLFK
ncbi:MAG: hypothetical protein ACXVC6_11440 [Bacteroidia bacterium]